MKQIILYSLFSLLIIGSSGCGKQLFLENPAVKQFIERFDKEKFLLQVEEERKSYEDITKRLKTEGVKDSELTRKYTSTQRAYNLILDQMILDIKATNNIVSFKVFDANSKYNIELAEARKHGELFLEGARIALKDENLAVHPIVSFAVVKIWPVIKNVHEKYLEYCKLKMESRINESKFKFYDDII